MISRDIAKLKATPGEWRKFGLVVGGVLALLGGWLHWRGGTGAVYAWSVSVPLVILGAAWPRALRWPYLAWMSLGIVLGTIVSTVLLTLFYYLLLTPLGLIARASGKDFMRRRRVPDGASYWIRRSNPGPREPSRYEQQF